MSKVDPGTVSYVGIAIPSYRDGPLAIDLCRAFLKMRGISRPLCVAIISNGPRERCFDSIEGLRREFEVRGWRLDHDHNTQRGKCLAWERAEEFLGARCAGIIYLDADIRLDEAAISQILERIGDGTEPLLLAPQVRVVSAANAVVNAYGRIWARLPHVRKDVVGGGCFAVTREGRTRWGKWPVVFADDTFVRFNFKAGERQVIDGVHFDISLPAKTMDLVRIRARWIQGYELLLEQIPELVVQEDRRWAEAVRYFLPRVWLYPSCVVFLAIWCAARAWLLFSGDAATRDWARADSTLIRRHGGGEA